MSDYNMNKMRWRDAPGFDPTLYGANQAGFGPAGAVPYDALFGTNGLPRLTPTATSPVDSREAPRQRPIANYLKNLWQRPPEAPQANNGILSQAAAAPAMMSSTGGLPPAALYQQEFGMAPPGAQGQPGAVTSPNPADMYRQEFGREPPQMSPADLYRQEFGREPPGQMAGGGGNMRPQQPGPVPMPPQRPDFGDREKMFMLDAGDGSVLRPFMSPDGQAPNIPGMTAFEDEKRRGILSALFGRS